MAGSAVEPEHTFNSTDSIDLITSVKNILHFHSAWILFVIFLTAFISNGILSAEPASDSNGPVQLGPGGKPLPPSAKRTKEERDKRQRLLDFSPTRKAIFRFLSIGLIATFLANGINIVSHALSEQDGWWCGEATGLYVCASAFFYCIVLISLLDTSPSPNIAHQITWIAATIVEVTLLVITCALYIPQHKDINSLERGIKENYSGLNEWEIIELVCDGIRVIILIFLVIFYTFFSLERIAKFKNFAGSESDEAVPLLVNGCANGNIPSIGGLTDNGSDYASQVGNNDVGIASNRDQDPPAFYKPTKVPDRTWWEYLRGYSVFFPYLWPSKSLRLKLIVVVCFLLIICQRAVNIAVPLQIGKVTDQLANKDPEHPTSGMPWLSISLLIIYKLLQGSSGILGSARSVLWIPISQYSYQALTTASFEHVHGLSLDFHLSKRTGEVLSALSKGNAINNFLEQVTFQVAPMIFDLGVAIVYFGIAFDAYYALIVAVITFSYLYLTVRMARWRSDQRRQMTNLSREEDAVKNDSLISYETVKYFNAEKYEFKRYRDAVRAFQGMEYKVNLSLNVLNISQNMVFMTGLLMTSFISAYQVTTHARKVGDFVTLLTYMAQLQQPLNFFGSFYRSVQSAMISGERLLELFKELPTVIDEPGAIETPVCDGEIRFDNVKFSYDERKPALEGLSFTCRPGTTTALVGESGGGKSTVFRLLFRFYNSQVGSIQVDGHDVRDITIDSLRRHIAVVPQDTILFNETLMYNLKYANPDATDADVFAACRAASIHDKILAFPDGYDTKVGERGLRLSGGEKQRVAIARAIIKNPRIILLDEATAALDSETEQNIQNSLTKLSEGRTVLVIAHRLSTITAADQILVLHAGKVVEAGNHNDLLQSKGRYYNMWKKQIRAERAMEQASAAIAKAQALKEAVVQRPDSSGNEASPSEDASDMEIGAYSYETCIPGDEDKLAASTKKVCDNASSSS
ncbi:BgTH12-07103 [Blumeria graminis f. sp. triticale]|uniref:Mitochondrial inner membrane ATP-binding cassette transporter n=4 Tax=Blumeria graminis TaxID=34373 RepID=A0A656KKE2_BLUGR|nr:Mitochondrial inner membrane ATP-binding cassette transporter [Blumeria graminis f. sp. tritici 96224]CAD6506173.1 BgTH12-07103 [Blumeria graminis f. sp. triticale]VDB94878.1 Bgt-2023 [Blumeria graminis f. sp. tritici]